MPSLNAFMALGPSAWRETRTAVREALEAGAPTIPLDRAEAVLPVAVGDFVDFYSSLHHATSMGRMFRPDAEPLLPNWRRIPVGYHGRAGTLVVGGTPIRRPHGVITRDDGEPRLAPTRALDIELEAGFVIGAGSTGPVTPDEAAEHVFGLARQRLERARHPGLRVPASGPVLGQVLRDDGERLGDSARRADLHAASAAGATPDPYLRAARPWGIDLNLSVELNGVTICETNFREMYWTFAQQLAHMTVNGASTRTGDLFASGTVSGPGERERGSLIELTWRGRDPITLPGGSTRTFLQDGDRVVLRGRAGEVALAPFEGTIAPAAG